MDYRPNIENLSAADLAAFATALSKMQAISDNRGFSHFASMHGWPNYLCQHGNPLFLPWHRAYLYNFELALRDLGGPVRLPWWDWTSAQSQATGVPDAYTSQAPLASWQLPLDAATLQQVEKKAPYAVDVTGPTPMTVRHPRDPSELPTSDDVQNVLGASSFSDFTSQLEQIHNSVHGWFAGTMAIVPLAAFDPIFWAHHTMIDRLWYLWQLQNPSAPMPGGLTGHALQGFSQTVSQVLDVTTLGYEYASQVTQ
jgi:tyrosinase